MGKFETTIIILTKNAEQSIKRSLPVIFRQKIKSLPEIIILDNNSTDKTLEIIKMFPQIKLIQSQEFNHGRTRNIGARLAQGKYLVFLNGDALPKDEYWLARLLENFEKDQRLAGVYSRHLPKKGCHLYLAIELLRSLGPLKRIQKLTDISKQDLQNHIMDLIRFSTVSCAIKKQVWQKFPFNENLSLAEDQDWSKRVLEDGYSIVYEPASMVFHSHNYTLRQKFKYHAQCSQVFNLILGRKKSSAALLWRVLLFPVSILTEIAWQTNYARKRNYRLGQILKQGLITILLRLAALLGDIWGNK